MPSWHTIWDTEVLRNSLGDWTLALAALFLTVAVLALAKGYFAARRRRWRSRQTEPSLALQIAALLAERTRPAFIIAIGLYFGVQQLDTVPVALSHRLHRVGWVLIVFIIWFQVGLWLMAVLRLSIDKRRQHLPVTDPAHRTVTGSFELMMFVAGLVVWTIMLMLALDNLGIAIQPLLAGLGIGGIAVALAVQSVLGDLLASISIALDKPFVVGDVLTVDDFTGTVEKIGVKSTRLRSVSGEQIVMSNADVLKSRVRNFGRMNERRSLFQLYVIYDTPTEVLAAIPAAVRAIIEAQPNVRFDRCHLLTCGPTSLQFEVVYFVLTSDFMVYAERQHAINLAILQRFRELGVQFATPVLGPMPALRKQ
jgi:small-conductance mechanosensitive channel